MRKSTKLNTVEPVATISLISRREVQDFFSKLTFDVNKTFKTWGESLQLPYANKAKFLSDHQSLTLWVVAYGRFDSRDSIALTQVWIHEVKISSNKYNRTDRNCRAKHFFFSPSFIVILYSITASELNALHFVGSFVYFRQYGCFP